MLNCRKRILVPTKDPHLGQLLRMRTYFSNSRNRSSELRCVLRKTLAMPAKPALRLARTRQDRLNRGIGVDPAPSKSVVWDGRTQRDGGGLHDVRQILDAEIGIGFQQKRDQTYHVWPGHRGPAHHAVSTADRRTDTLSGGSDFRLDRAVSARPSAAERGNRVRLSGRTGAKGFGIGGRQAHRGASGTLVARRKLGK